VGVARIAMDDLLFIYKQIKLVIRKEILLEFTEYKQLSYNQNESGGMLIGSILKRGDVIEINDITHPVSGDTATITTFKRSDLHNNILKKKWEESSYTKMYIGEWHTHPQDVPMPSLTDQENWKKLLMKAKTESPILLFIIVGKKSNKIWVGEKCGKNISVIEMR
jgi:integrative and conjugative element protein (TIGR02256 family)